MDVIALISGGKDSFFSLLHSIANGHRIVALANLHPPIPNTSPEITTHLPTSTPSSFTAIVEGTKDELDSFMYQTVGHGLLPFYPNALNVPLYRFPITGSSVDQNLSYRFLREGGQDETEDLIPLLRHVLKQHPSAKAISTGAILSTYQRTRIESVCERLGLTSLSYLWQRKQEEILEEMDMVGLDARIVKVAALGLDAEKWIWRNVTNVRNRRLLEGLQKKWGVHVAGEGGEYETIVVDGPGWRGRIEVGEKEREIVDGGGGVGHAKILGAKFIMREGEVKEQMEWVSELKKPGLWDQDFEAILEALEHETGKTNNPQRIQLNGGEKIPSKSIKKLGKLLFINNLTSNPPVLTDDISQEMLNIMTSLSEILSTHNTDFSRITSTTLLLRSMISFVAANKAYSTHFTAPNPPSRVCISAGDGLPKGINVMLSVTVDLPATDPEDEEGRRKGLHVQSRSYWAPANIGPYSQAISVGGWTAFAGMIPLVPATMAVVNAGVSKREVEEQALLALQHMWRVAKAVDIAAFLGCIAYVVGETGKDAAQRAWKQLWKGWKGEVGFRGLWEGAARRSGDDEGEDMEDAYGDGLRPPLIIVSVEGLPRSCAIEWAGTGLDLTWSQRTILRKRYNDDGAGGDDYRPGSGTGYGRGRWGVESGAEVSKDGLVASSSIWYGAWSQDTRIYLPSGGGGLKMLCFPLPSAGSEAERVGSLVTEVVAKVAREEMGFVAGGVVVYVPAATGTIGSFMEAWDIVAEQRDVKFAVQVVPVKEVWDCNGVEAGLGVAVRMAGPWFGRYLHHD